MSGHIQNEVRVVIAGGGTGGHLFPGLATGKEFVKRVPGSRILFVIGRRKMESDLLKRSGFEQKTIHVEGLKGRGWKKGLMVFLKLPYGFLQSVFILKRFSPHLVLGVGGYASGPVCLAAKIRGVPTAIHEQNSFPGLTNRLLSRVVDRVFISFEESREHFPEGNLQLTGNPVREELFGPKGFRERADVKFTLLAVGGSQGARSINRALVGALEILRAKGKDLHVIHQTGEMDYPQVVRDYEQRGLKGEIIPFIEDMADAYHQADMVVSRAGASTVSELAALGKPSILVPYPFAANRHQETNARMLVQTGGAEMMLEGDLSGEGLAELLWKYMEDRAALLEMGRRAQSTGRRDAAKIIVDQLMEMIKWN